MTSEATAKTACSVDAQVVRCTPVCRQHVEIEFTLPDFPPSEPGQFLQLLCRPSDRALETSVIAPPADGFPSSPGSTLCTPQAFLRRPLSIADHWQAADGSSHLCIISRTVGPGTAWLERLRPGDALNLTGPLGRGFRIPADEMPLVLIGGGVGIPPLLYLARRLHERKRRTVTAIFGATRRDLLPLRLSGEPATDGTPQACVDYPGASRFPAIITSNDGSVGLCGMVTDGLRGWAARHAGAAPRGLVFACGPDAMLKAVADSTRELGMDCQLCIERNMGCGLGACLSCVVRARDDARAEGWRWALACTDGPVFMRDELLDYAPQTDA